MGMWQCLLAAILAASFKESSGHGQDNNEEIYVHPSGCYVLRWDGPDPNDVYLTCNAFSVQNTTNFEIVVAKHLLGFYINCTSLGFFSNLGFGALSHLYFLEELVFDGCQFRELPSDSLRNLTRLGALVIADTHPYPHNNSPGLYLPDDLLINNQNLSIIHLINNAIQSLPSHWLCSSPQIMLLSFPVNRFKSLDAIGCGQNGNCCCGAQGLNLSHNALSELRKIQLEQLVKMQVLDFRNNRITFIEDGSFDTMGDLSILDLSNNKLTTLHEKLFQNNLGMQQLLIGGNFLTEISPELCCNRFNYLLLFDVSGNNVINLTDNMFNNSHLLMMAALSYNSIRFIPAHLFNTFYNVSLLNLDNCLLEQLPDGVFSNANSLANLALMNNKLQYISSDTLQGLQQLKNLNMSGNAISSIHKEAFADCPLMQSLDLSNNQLVSVPDLPLFYLKFLSLSHNRITEINSNVYNLTSLAYLDLSHNHIKSVTTAMCSRGRTQLNHLDLSYNQIHTISSKAFNVCLSLDTLLLNHNNFTRFDKRVTYKLPKLYLLDLSHNHLMFFDYNVVPDALQYLDISYNHIVTLDDTQQGMSRLQMKTMIAHDNRVEGLITPCLPNKIQVVDLSRNHIKYLIGSIFDPLFDLKLADLSNNQLSGLDENAFTLRSPRPRDQPLPKVILSGNMPYCTCELAWLVHKYQSGQPKYVEITKPYYCRVTHKRMQHFTGLVNLQSPPADILDPTFFCPYKLSDKPDGVPPCLESCSCYYNFERSYFEVDCGSKTWNTNVTKESLQLPSRTKRLFLDGNVNLPLVANLILRNVTQLKQLFMNGSGIEILKSNQFNGLPELEELHLENNFVSVISGTEFDGLVQLKKLFLHANYLKTVNMQAFQNLISLQLLTLHNNQLSTLSTWHSVMFSFDITLRENWFECTCNFQRTIQLWARNIVDLSQVRCLDNDTSVEFSAYNETYCQEEAVAASRDQTIVILATVCGLLFLVTSGILLLYIYRLEMQVWVYSRYGIRFFHHNHNQDDGKLFDAFISYSSDDDKFVAQELVPRLEREMRFRLCIHQRDFPVGGFITETIVDAVENSCRTLLVLTRSFVASEWCRFEFKMAHHRSMQDRCCRLIVIIVEDVDSTLMDKELQLYLQTNTYLRWEDKLFWEKLIFAMPDPPEFKNTA